MGRKPRRPRVTVQCQNCGADFTVTPSNLERGKGKYCSQKCRYDAAKTKVRRICPICNSEFEAYLSDIKRGKGKYCSVKCQHKASENQIERICEYCGKTFLTAPSNVKFSGAKFCSKKCVHEARRNRVKCICKNCGKEFEVWPSQIEHGEGQFCSTDCYKKWNHGENHPSWRGGVSFEPYCPKFNKAKKEAVREEWGRVCAACGKTEQENGSKLRVHHIDYDKEQGCKGKEFFLIPLCTSCHGKTNRNRKLWTKKLTKIYEEHKKNKIKN